MKEYSDRKADKLTVKNYSKTLQKRELFVPILQSPPQNQCDRYLFNKRKEVT